MDCEAAVDQESQESQESQEAQEAQAAQATQAAQAACFPLTVLLTKLELELEHGSILQQLAAMIFTFECSTLHGHTSLLSSS
jgi:hypothetical protein